MAIRVHTAGGARVLPAGFSFGGERLIERRNAARVAITSGGVGGGLLLAAVLGLAHLAIAQFVLIVNDPVQVGMNFWPPAGLALGALLLLPTRRWGWAIATIAAAEAISNAIHGHPWNVNIWFMGSNTIEPLIGATLIRRFTIHRGALVPVRGLLEFIAFGVLLAPVVGGGIGSIGSAIGGANFLDAWPRFMVGDAIGVLVVTPVLLSIRRWRNDRPMRTAIAPTILTVIVAAFALHAWPGGWDTVTPYLVIPPLTWAALRSGVRGAAWSVLAVGQVANLAVAGGVEPFAATMDTGYTVTLLQAYLGIVACTVLLLASATSELSDRDAVEAELRRQAQHDTLTGLPNRLYLAEYLGRAIRRAHDGGEGITMCVVDLDDFKAVNDQYGHPTGDELLIASAQRLQAAVRDTDFVARIGGDEFVVILDGAEAGAVDSVTSRIVERLSAPVEILGRTVQTTVSVGVASTDRHPATHADATAEDLFREADAALYRAKAEGRGRVAGTRAEYAPAE